MKETCVTCKYGLNGDWHCNVLWGGGIICVNDDSDKCTEFVTADGYCGMWESK